MKNRTEEELKGLIEQVQDMIETVATDRSISNPDLRHVLRFLTKVVQIVDQAFQDVYTTLIELKYLTLDDIHSKRLQELREELELLCARDRVRDAEQICSRLHQLSVQYENYIEPIIGHLRDNRRWCEVFYLINECEGWIIQLMQKAIRELEQMLQGPFDENSISSIRRTASEKAEIIRASLIELQSLRDQILGLSDEAGFLELTETDRSSLEQQVVVLFNQDDHSITHGHRVNVSNVSGGKVIIDAQISSSGLTAQDAIELIEQLKHVIAQETLPQQKKDRVLRQLEEAKAEAQANNPDRNYITTCVKKATEILKEAGALITATTTLGRLLLPLIEWIK